MALGEHIAILGGTLASALPIPADASHAVERACPGVPAAPAPRPSHLHVIEGKADRLTGRVSRGEVRGA